MKIRIKNWPKLIAEGVLIAIISGLCAWLFVIPVFWQLADRHQDFQSAFNQIFFNPSGRTQTIGGGIDSLGTIWIFSNVYDMVSGRSGTILPGIFYPVGFDLGKHTGFAWVDALLAWPLVHHLGTPGFYNLHVLLSLTLTQFTATILFRCAKAPLPIAIALGAFALLHPFAITEVFQGRVTQVYWLFHCLFLIGLLRLQNSNHKLIWTMIVGVSLSASCLVYWFGGAALGFCGYIGYGFCLLIGKKKWQRFWAGLASSVIAVTLTLAVTWRVSKDFLQGKGEDLFPHLRQADRYNVDFLGWTVPIQSAKHVSSWEQLWQLVLESQIGAPILLITAICLFLPFAYKKHWPWLLAGLIGLSIPLGPALHWPGGWSPTGYAFLHSIFPPLARCTIPHRMVVAPILLLLMFSAFGLGKSLEKLRYAPVRILLSWGIGIYMLIWAVQFRPVASQTNKGSFGFDPVLFDATQKWPGGLIDVPLMRSQYTYIQQVFHRQPILGGPGLINVRPWEHQLYSQRNSVLRSIEELAEKGITTRKIKEEDKRKLWNDGFRLIVIHLSYSKGDKESYRSLFANDGVLDTRGNRLFIPLIEPESTP